MKVTLLNSEDVSKLFINWSETSAVCYDTDIEKTKPGAIGKHCMNSGHFSGSRGDFIKFRVDDAPRFTLDQLFRSEIGVFKNMGSFRYIDKHTFSYEIPRDILDNQELVDKYIAFMDHAMETYTEIQEYVYNKTNKHERANEQARYVLPIATHTACVIGFTIEALIHLMNMRLCVRTEDIYRELAMKMRDEVLEVLPELRDKLVPNCQAMLYCPEGRQSCGAYPTKKELQEMIKQFKEG